MDKNQISDLMTRIESIQNMDIDSIVAEIFKDQDISTITIGQFSVEEYVSTLKRLLKQFKTEFEDNGFYLPLQYNFQNEFGGGNLQNDIQSLASQLSSKTHANLNSSVGFLNRLIYFQIANGFWDKSVKKVHKANEVNITELNDKLNFAQKLIQENFESLKKQLSFLNDEKKNLQDFIAQKNQELQQVANNLQSSNTNSSQISQLLNNSTATNEKINSLLSQQNQNLESQKKKSETQDSYFIKQKETFDTLEKTLNEKIKQVEGQIIDFTSNLEFVASKKGFFEERNNYLNELIGREVGASLFETFKQRKTELITPVGKWLWIVIGMSVLTFVAILAIFTNGFGLLGIIPTDFTTTILITNAIKTLPFFFLLFYSISQYNKERNFQEEYAFKSAVALTIKAYADIIQKDDLKDELIINSVSGIYKSPTIYRTRKTKEDNSMLDTAKDLLTTALDVLKKK